MDTSAVLRGGNGADDESAGRVVESEGEENPVVGGRRDSGSDGPDDAALAGEVEGKLGLVDRRKGKPSDKRVPLARVEEVLRLYQETYFDLNVRHFHEKLSEEHAIKLSYAWVQKALQGAGLVGTG